MFLTNHPESPLEYGRPIVEFIHANKFGGEVVLTADGPRTLAAPWPGFLMEGRTPQSLMRLVRAWSLNFEDGEANGLAWERSGIQPYRFITKQAGANELDWSIVELLNSSALFAEGRAMCHCVHSYARKCKRGDSSIWSLRLRTGNMEKRLVTIEVDPRRRAIIQLKSKHNRTPGVLSSEIIARWAAGAGLQY
jgi:hypothetical protein